VKLAVVQEDLAREGVGQEARGDTVGWEGRHMARGLVPWRGQTVCECGRRSARGEVEVGGKLGRPCGRAGRCPYAPCPSRRSKGAARAGEGGPTWKDARG
jgi:hypothetical protein